jgi:hypothetical protein
MGMDDAAKRSPELQVLDRYIGDWEVVATVSGTDVNTKTIEHRTWSKQGSFLLSENEDLTTGKEAHFLVTYDPKGKQYRCCFINDEFTVPMLGTWDEQTQTMHWKSADVAFKHDATSRLIDKDTAEYRMTVTSPEGKVVFELSSKQTRRKK